MGEAQKKNKMKHNLSIRNRRLLAFLLIGVIVLVMATTGRSLPTGFRWGFATGLLAAAAVVGFRMWQRVAFMRRLRVSADRNNKCNVD